MFNWKYLKRGVASYLELFITLTLIHIQELKYAKALTVHNLQTLSTKDWYAKERRIYKDLISKNNK